MSTSCTYCLRNGTARSLYCCEYFLKKKISCGRNVLLHGYEWRLRFGALSLRFWLKTNSFATLTRVFFSQTSTRVHQILTSTHNHEVTPYSPTRPWFYQWKWQCSKSWSHSQNSLCSQISIRQGCACGMLDGGCLLLFTITKTVKRGEYIHATSFTERGSRAHGVMHGPYTWRTWLTRDQYVHACKAEDDV